MASQEHNLGTADKVDKLSFYSAPKSYSTARGRQLVINGQSLTPLSPGGLTKAVIYDIFGQSVLSHTNLTIPQSEDFDVIAEIATDNLSGGLYSYQIFGPAGAIGRPVYFHIYDEHSTSKIALMHPVFTWQAYNTYCGDSFYAGAQYETEKIIEVDLNRPLLNQSDFHTPQSLIPPLKLFAANDIHVDSVCNLMLHENEELLSKYDVLILMRHDEYWTHEMFDRLETFMKRGGNVAVFSANILCWAVEINNGKIKVDKRNQYIEGESAPRNSGHFRNPWINRQQQSLFGLAYWYAGYPVSRIPTAKALTVLKQDEIDKSDDIIIIDSAHDIFNGVEIVNNRLVTHDHRLLDVELDGVFLDGDNVDFTRTVDVPKSTKILAKSLVNIAHTHVAKTVILQITSILKRLELFQNVSLSRRAGGVYNSGRFVFLEPQIIHNQTKLNSC